MNQNNLSKLSNFFKPFILLSLLLFQSIQAARGPVTTKILKVSEFMMAPVSSWVEGVTSKNPAVPVTEEVSPAGDLGFRVIHLRSFVQAKKDAAFDLASTGMLKAGDVLLSFRPEWDGTLAYAHMQLGVSHTGLAFVLNEGGKDYVHTLESPISYSSPLNYTEHYSDLNAIHVIRPDLNDDQRNNLSKWARLVMQHKERFTFFKDYGSPFYKRGTVEKGGAPGVSTPLAQVKHLGKVILGTQSGPYPTYCSEWAWAILGLQNCNPDDFKRLGSDAFLESCAKTIYDTKNSDGSVNGALTGLIPNLKNETDGKGNAGLIQGPEAALQSRPVAERTSLLTKNVFKNILSSPVELAGRMSSGHRAVAEANSGLMDMIREKYYAPGEPSPDPVAKAINAQVVNNFSPTSFLIRSNAGLDGFQYVGTVVFDR